MKKVLVIISILLVALVILLYQKFVITIYESPGVNYKIRKMPTSYSVYSPPGDGQSSVKLWITNKYGIPIKSWYSDRSNYQYSIEKTEERNDSLFLTFNVMYEATMLHEKYLVTTWKAEELK